jgi:hypothetical protein
MKEFGVCNVLQCVKCSIWVRPQRRRNNPQTASPRIFETAAVCWLTVRCVVCFCRVFAQWNWATRETGKDSTALKNKARQTGSLWGAGELHFQQVSLPQ